MMINSLTEIKNASITKVIAGGSNGSIVLIDFKTKDANYVLYIYCAWRLSNKGKVLTGSNDNSETSDSVYVHELTNLDGDIINKISSNDLGDFSLFFKSGRELAVFCDITSNGFVDEKRDNWTLCNVSENMCFSLTNYFDFYKEPYS